MRRRLRIVLGLLILSISILLLAWGFLPARRETRVQPIPPADLQLPVPESFRFDPALSLGASSPQPYLSA